jgi:hypothetical protein
MIGLTVFAGILAIGTACLGSQAAAQSPSPALLAPWEAEPAWRPCTQCRGRPTITPLRGPVGHLRT